MVHRSCAPSKSNGKRCICCEHGQTAPGAGAENAMLPAWRAPGGNGGARLGAPGTNLTETSRSSFAVWPPGSGSAKAGCVQSLLAYALGSKPIVLQQGGGERGGRHRTVRALTQRRQRSGRRVHLGHMRLQNAASAAQSRPLEATAIAPPWLSGRVAPQTHPPHHPIDPLNTTTTHPELTAAQGCTVAHRRSWLSCTVSLDRWHASSR